MHKPIEQKAMPVFISYTRADEAVARQIHTILTAKQVTAYLDLLDPQIAPDRVTQAICNGLNRCTHLLAVVSRETRGSWWVPFEIGVATQGDRRITTFVRDLKRVDLPHYLQIWPILIADAQLDTFARLYLQDRMVLENKGLVTAARSADIQNASQFHARLRGAIGQ